MVVTNYLLNGMIMDDPPSMLQQLPSNGACFGPTNPLNGRSPDATHGAGRNTPTLFGVVFWGAQMEGLYTPEIH